MIKERELNAAQNTINYLRTINHQIDALERLLPDESVGISVGFASNCIYIKPDSITRLMILRDINIEKQRIVDMLNEWGVVYE